MTDDNSPLLHAQTEAGYAGVAGWFFVGFFLGLIGILIVYVRSPTTPVALTAQYAGDDRYIFVESYVQTLKRRQIAATWIGLVVSIGLGIFIVLGLFASVATMFA